MSLVKQSIHIARAKRHHIYLIFFACLIALSTSAMGLYYLNFSTSQRILISQVQKRQLVINRAGRLAVAQFFTTLENQLLGLTTVTDIKNQTPGRTQEVLDEVFQTHTATESPLFAMFFLNTSGTITAVSDLKNSRATIGQNFADRDYFTWTKDPSHKGKIFISDPFISRGALTKGETIIIMTSPVYSVSGKYEGAVGALITFDTFINMYIKPLGMNQPELWLLTRDGTLLAGGDGDETLFMNFFTYEKDHRWENSTSFVSGLHDLLGKNEDTFSWMYRTPVGNIKEVYGASAKIAILNKEYWLVVSNSREQILAPLISGPYAIDLVPFITVLATLIAGLVFVIVSRIAEHDGYIAGYLAAKKDLTPRRKESK